MIPMNLPLIGFIAFCLLFCHQLRGQSLLPDLFDPGADGEVRALAVQADGKILVGGSFNTLGGQPRKNIGRLHSDGRLDEGFNPGVIGTVNAIQVQADGGILVGGEFSTLGGQFRRNLGRLHPDGRLDTTFTPGGDGGVMRRVHVLGVQTDGKVVVGGDSALLRFHANGTLDDVIRLNFDGPVQALAIQDDGSILAGGSFKITVVDGDGDTIAYFNLVRVGPGGVLDQDFYPDPDSGVSCLVVQPDGRILLSGGFSRLDVGNSDVTRLGLGRIDRNGNVDSGFNPAINGWVHSIVLQTDGKILLGGSFNQLGGQPRSGIGRLNANGTVDSSFNPGADGTVYSLAVQGDGRVLLGGNFATLGGQGRSRIGRIQNNNPATESLNLAGSTITWLRGGSSPEFSRATFEYTTDGVRWTSVAGNRVAGGWQLTGVSLPAGTPIQARGYVVGGLSGGSGWIVESYYGRPGFITQPVSITNDFGTPATFQAAASGASSYRWLKNGNSLQDQGHISGTATPTLALNPVSKADEGAYQLVLTNRFGSVTSVVATLTVRDPFLVSQPASASRNPGESVTFSVTASGSTTPLSYQWHHNGKPVPGAVGASLTLAAVSPADAGSYSVVVSSSVGSLTSAPALLTINTTILERAFDPAASAELVSALAVQTDGKILVGGRFSFLGNVYRRNFGRLNADGTLDRAFDAVADQEVRSVVLQMDGKILVGGLFSSLGGQPRSRLARVNADGTLDASFTNGARGQYISTLALQADGRILVGGSFTELGGQPRRSIGRLNTNGTVDTTFNPGTGGWVESLAIQSDGRILLGGTFTNLGGQPVRGLVRLNANGTIDANFNPVPEGWVLSMAVQADGRTLVGGSFTTLAGQSRAHIGRLLANGTLDTTFNPGANGPVVGLALQADGKILVGGSFTEMAGQSRFKMARLNGDGTLDTSFDPGTDAAGQSVNVFAVQPDGRTLVGGTPEPVAGSTNRPLARLSATEPAIQSLNYAGTTLTWLRGGTSPEVARVQFESTTNGTVWSDLGEATRIAGGWQKTGVRLPANATVRARGPVSGDGFGSGWFVEQFYGALRILSQPAHRTNDFRSQASFTVVANAGEPLRYVWLKNGVPMEAGRYVSGVNGPTLTLNAVTQADQGNYSVIVSSSLESVTSAAATLSVNAEVLDTSFNPGTLQVVSALAVEPGGQILLGGQFSLAAGQLRDRIARLQSDGTLDVNFNPGANNAVLALTRQPDGKTLVGGIFSTLDGQPRSHLGRLHADGTLDTSFDPQVTGRVFCLLVQEDGRILVGGEFFSIGGQDRRYLARLLPDGRLDTTFNPGAGAAVHTMAVQADGKIVVGGLFTALSGQPRARIGRLHPDGRLDESFNPGVSGPVHCLAVQADGSLLVGGGFTNLASRPRASIGRLLPNGTLDNAFNPGTDGTVQSIVVLSNGKILVGGAFNTLGGQGRGRLGRLHPDGTLDTTFVADASGPVHGLAVQADGRVLVVGDFQSLASQTRGNVARLLSSEPSTQNLSHDGSTLTWMRSGGGPEVWRTRFESSADGSTWTDLGAGTRIPGGWQRTGVVLTASGRVRARGYAAGGEKNGSGSMVESSLDFGPPLLAAQPQSLTNRPGSTARFSIAAQGDGPLTFQWLKDGAPLPDQGNVSGVNSATLVLSPVSPADAGNYSVRVSNTFGSVMSSPALLTIFFELPRLASQPQSLTNRPGSTATFSVAAQGDRPHTFQWLKDGAPLTDQVNVSGVTSATLVLSPVSPADAGSYSVKVSNAFGSATSSPALLTIISVSTRVDGWDLGIDDTPYGSVRSLVVQPNGKILVGGFFKTRVSETFYTITRQNPDGSPDASFRPASSGIVNSMVLQPDAKILVGGTGRWSGAEWLNTVVRLNPDGTQDANFEPGAAGEVFAMALQQDGRILVGGDLTRVAGQSRRGIARLNPEGTLDTGFDPGAEGTVNSLALQPDGSILVGGSFTNLAGQVRRGIARLHPDGTLDSTFNPGVGGHIPEVSTLVVQPDGKIVVGGWFWELAGKPRRYLGRLNTDGTLDAGFNPEADLAVSTLALQANGQMFLGGWFKKIGGQSQSFLARLNHDGSVDPFFDAQVDDDVRAVALQGDGRILVGGSFSNITGQARNRIARLENNEPATQTLSHEGGMVSWIRGGSSPEVSHTTLESSTDGSPWTHLGTGTRSPNGWQWTGVSLPPNATLRARGYVASSYQSGIVETLLSPSPGLILTVVRDGSSLTLNWSGGTGPFQIQATADLDQPNPWKDLGSPLQERSATLPLGPGIQFFRIRQR